MSSEAAPLVSQSGQVEDRLFGRVSDEFYGLRFKTFPPALKFISNIRPYIEKNTPGSSRQSNFSYSVKLTPKIDICPLS